MSGIMIIILFTIIQFIAGFGLLNLFNIQLKPGLLISLAILLGVMVFSIMPFLLQLAYIPLTSTNVFISIIVACVLLNIKFKSGIARLQQLKATMRFKLKIYEIPYLVMIIFIVFVSAWRCFYFPPTPRDLTSGAEVIAEYAIREKTMINSVFSVNLETTNNVFKSPFITCLQIIYKYAGFEFGQVWLSTIVTCFLIFLYQALTLTVHRLFAGLLVLFFMAIPEMFAYTFMVLFDYANAAYFCLSVWFLYQFFQNQQRNYLAFAGLLMAFATYIRSETLILGCMMAPAIVWYHWKNKTGMVKGLISSAWFVVPSVLSYIISVTIYINKYLPVKYNIQSLVNKNLGDLSPLFDRFTDINSKLIFSDMGVGYYGYFIYFFLLLLLLELVIKRQLTPATRNWLYAVLVIYIGFPVMAYLLPLLDLNNSTKRGLFKIFPLMLLYMANNSLLVSWSQKIMKWETK
ncbi:hypothetical protein A3860_10240 [Niastella vici]|uniref:Glycosyltransferase RgtA/B/C/D-like domain-containing protein n=1 Tax=Niastella vici TaxID=1703345 RepID=A0A1V9FFE6_9BACT|nr:hypothetical protein [Niastella vici]OQP56946.1 hypothetical protein A3860_10240 [Niastella vici]